MGLRSRGNTYSRYVITYHGYARCPARPAAARSFERNRRSVRALGPSWQTGRVRSNPQCWLTDMDGVLVREEHALPGAADFLQRLVDKKRPFLVLTNNSIFTPRDLS